MTQPLTVPQAILAIHAAQASALASAEIMEALAKSAREAAAKAARAAAACPWYLDPRRKKRLLAVADDAEWAAGYAERLAAKARKLAEEGRGGGSGQ